MAFAGSGINFLVVLNVLFFPWNFVAALISVLFPYHT